MKLEKRLLNILNKNWHILVIVLLCLVPLLWFANHRDAIINGVDTNFPLNPIVWFLRRFYVWNGFINGGSNVASSAAGIFFHLVQVVPYILGFGIQTVNVISLIFWFSLIIISSFLFSTIIVPKSKMAQILIVVFYSFNIYLFNTWENVKVSNLSVAVCFPLILYLLIAIRGRRISLGRFVVGGLVTAIIASGSGINPAYFLTLILLILAYTILNLKEWKKGLLLLIIFISVNFFWIVSTFYFLFLSDKSITSLSDIGFINWVSDLSKNSSTLNILRLQGAWDWYAFDPGTHNPSYLPYVVNYLNSTPFILFSFLLPAFSILSMIFSKKENIKDYLLFALFMVTGIFLGMGTHPPTGFLFMFMSQHVPFFSFFRSPWYIFTPFLTISMASLVGLLWERFDIELKVDVVVKFLIFAAFVQMNLLYTYPLLTGKIFRPSRHDGFYVNFPEYVYDAENYLNKQNELRLLAYPDDAIEKFKWGYRGLDTVLNLFTNVETINTSISPTSSFLDVYKNTIYFMLKREEYDGVFKLMNLVSIDGLFYKNDADSLSPAVSEEDLAKFGEVTKIGQWGFAISDAKKVFEPEKIFINYDDNEYLSYAGAVLPKNSLVLNHNDSEVDKAIDDSKVTTFAITRLEKAKDNVNTVFNVYVPRSGEYFAYVEKHGLGQISGVIDGKNMEKKLDGDFFKLGPVRLSEGKHELVILGGEEGVLIKDEILATNTGRDRFSNFIATDKFIFDPYSDYYLTYKYNFLSGSPAYTEAIQYNSQRFIKSFINYEEPSSGEKLLDINPIRTDSKLDIFLTLRSVDLNKDSESLYEDVRVIRKFDNKIIFIENFEDKKSFESNIIEYQQNNPTEYDIKIKNGENGVFLMVAENYTKDWGLSGNYAKAIHFTANGYGNGWYVKGNGDLNLKMYYKPQRIFIFGGLFSLLSIFSWIVFGVKYKR